MTSYRGVDKYDLADRVQAAKKFLDRINFGPATAEWFKDWSSTYPVPAIRSVSDNDELIAVMHKSEARSAFYPFQDVFAFYGMVALADDNEEDNAANLYADLADWGAFQNLSQKKELLEKVKQEVDSFLIIEAFRRLTLDENMRRGMAGGNDPAEEMAEKYIENLRQQKNRALADWLDDAIPVCSLLLRKGGLARSQGEDAVRKLLAESPLNARFFLKDMLCRMTGLDAYRSAVMSVPHPIFLYGVETRPGMGETMKAALRKKVGEILQPFNRLDEAWLKPADFVDSRAEGRPMVFFLGTARAAQKVADQVRVGKVLRFEGGSDPVEIKPKANPPRLPPPGPS
jgi:hypothetical protein